MNNLKNELPKDVELKIDGSSGYSTFIFRGLPILRFNDREINLNTGGKKTVIVKKRINQISELYNLGLYLYQKNFTWVIVHNIDSIHLARLYCDGMALIR